MKSFIAVIMLLSVFLTACQAGGANTVAANSQKRAEKKAFESAAPFENDAKKIMFKNKQYAVTSRKPKHPKDAKIHDPINAPLISQMPELARGCEVTSLTMMLQFMGKRVNKMELAKKIHKVPFLHNGLRGNPNDGFVGNIYTFSKPGLGVYHGPIVKLARQYIGDRVRDLTGKGWDTVEHYPDEGRPVWVIVTSKYRHLDPSKWATWNTKEGKIKITYHEHSVLLTGYDNHYVYFNDPLANIKNRPINKKNFIAGWKQFGEQAVSYQ